MIKTRESMENYLETIYILQQKTGYVRAIDIATELGFSKPSVSNAMKKLRAEGYITVTDRSKISLTEAGRKVRPLMNGIVSLQHLSCASAFRKKQPWKMPAGWSISSVRKHLPA